MTSSHRLITAFLPCRKGSERVLRKNIRPFGRHAFGLLEIKLAQLLSCPVIDNVILSTNDSEVIAFAKTLDNSKLLICQRPDHLAASTTSTDELIKHACLLVASGHILWTHVTSPFVDSAQYKAIVESYFNCIDSGYDSLMTTSAVHKFLWDENGPVNFDRRKEKWPRTQTLAPIHEVNSAVFLAPHAVYVQNCDRVGHSPYLYQLDRFTGFDIDWEEDFVIAEQMLAMGITHV